MPLANANYSMIVSTLGGHRFDAVLRALGAARDRVGEASRWAVLPEFRGQLGRSLVAASWAAARSLSIEWAFRPCRYTRPPDMALIHMGARPVSNIPLISSSMFDDELRLLYFDVSYPSEQMRRQMDEAALALKLQASFGPIHLNESREEV